MNTNPQEVGVGSSTPERARRASGGADDPVAALPDPEVTSKPRRRRFAAEYKRRILRETDQLREPGQLGAFLRREGLYSSALSRWRAQRDRGVLDALAPTRRGRKPAPHSAERARIAELERENKNLRARLRHADRIIEVQKKWPNCWTGDRQPGRTRSPHERRSRPRRIGRHPVRL